MDRHHDGTASASRVKLVVSYGGRIQPRNNQQQLCYIGGEIKILAVDRNIRFPAFLNRIGSLLPTGCDLCLKYQLPGEDLDALISITNDEDMGHMMAEYDRLLRSAPKSAPRLRLFLFSAVSSAGPAPPEQDAAPKQPAAAVPDYLFGFDKVSVSVPTAAKSDQGSHGAEAVAAVSSSETQRQRLQIPDDNHHQQQQVFQVGSMSRSSSNVSLSSPGLPGEHYKQRAEDKAAAAYRPEQRGRVGSMDGDDQPIYLIIPAGHPRMHPQVCYPVPRMMPPPEAYRESAPVYAVPPSPQPGRASSPYPEGGGAEQQQQQQEGAGYQYQVAYDSAGRAVSYASTGPTYHTVTTSSEGPTKPVGPKVVKQSQVRAGGPPL